MVVTPTFPTYNPVPIIPPPPPPPPYPLGTPSHPSAPPPYPIGSPAHPFTPGTYSTGDSCPPPPPYSPSPYSTAEDVKHMPTQTYKKKNNKALKYAAGIGAAGLGVFAVSQIVKSSLSSDSDSD